MTVFASLATIVASMLAIMMTVVSCRVLKGNPLLDNPVIHVAVGILTFIGLRYQVDGLLGQILIGYEAVAIAILFLLLLSWVGRICRSQFIENIRRTIQEYRGKVIERHGGMTGDERAYHEDRGRNHSDENGHLQ